MSERLSEVPQNVVPQNRRAEQAYLQAPGCDMPGLQAVDLTGVQAVSQQEALPLREGYEDHVIDPYAPYSDPL